MSDYKIRQQSVDGSGIEGQTTLTGVMLYFAGVRL